MFWLVFWFIVGCVVFASFVGGVLELLADWSADFKARRRRKTMRLLKRQDGSDGSTKPTSAIHQHF